MSAKKKSADAIMRTMRKSKKPRGRSLVIDGIESSVHCEKKYVINMPCQECGCNVMDLHADVKKIEKYQTMIFDLYEKKPLPKAEVRRLKIKRDIIMRRVWSELEEIGYWIRRVVLRDTGVPIDWRTGEYRVEDGEENAEAPDWESDELSDEEEGVEEDSR